MTDDLVITSELVLGRAALLGAVGGMVLGTLQGFAQVWP